VRAKENRGEQHATYQWELNQKVNQWNKNANREIQQEQWHT